MITLKKWNRIANRTQTQIEATKNMQKNRNILSPAEVLSCSRAERLEADAALAAAPAAAAFWGWTETSHLNEPLWTKPRLARADALQSAPKDAGEAAGFDAAAAAPLLTSKDSSLAPENAPETAIPRGENSVLPQPLIGEKWGFGRRVAALWRWGNDWLEGKCVGEYWPVPTQPSRLLRVDFFQFWLANGFHVLSTHFIYLTENLSQLPSPLYGFLFPF